MERIKGKIPKRRFEGFTDDWEQRKLYEVAEFNPKSELPDVFEYVDLESVVGTEMISHRTETRATAPSRAQRLARTGDVFYQTVRPYQKNNYLFEKPDKNYVFSTGYAQMRPNININFLMSFLQTDSFVKVVLDNCTGTSYPAINSTDLSNLEIALPSSKEEQEKIGKCISNIDHLITLHQRKLEKLKNIKKSYLSEMFPQEDEKKPKRRFKGFTDDWEQRKLGEVIEELYNGQTPSRNKESYWKGNISWLSSGELNRGIVSESIEKITIEGQKSANLRIVPQGTFVMAITGLEAPGTRGNCAILGFDTTLNQSCMALFPKKDLVKSEFLFQWYRKVGEEYGINYTQGTKQQSYNAELIKILPITLPSIEEQDKISECLFNLDHLITLHQRKLEKLKHIKQAYLNEMFV